MSMIEKTIIEKTIIEKTIIEKTIIEKTIIEKTIIEKTITAQPNEAAPNLTQVAAAPVASTERFASIDLLRGFALLGILTMNIISFALPGATRLNPLISGGFSGLNFGVWLFGYLFFDEKMITIFSMLFGAGLVLMTDRTETRSGKSAGFYYRRIFILLAIGLCHAYLIWDGDILVTYALCGMIIYLFRKLSPRHLVIIGLLLLVPAALLSRNVVAPIFLQARAGASRVEAVTARGETPSRADKELAETWREIEKSFNPTPAQTAAGIKMYREGSYIEIARLRAPESFTVETQLFLAAFVWLVTGRMLIGMGLMKLGLFSAARSLRFYWLMLLLGYGIGLPMVGLGAYWLIEKRFDVTYLFGFALNYNDFFSLFVALGHIAVFMLLYKTGTVAWLTQRLAAVGRMALTNYLLQSLICTTLFYGYGFGLYGRFNRIQVYGIMLIVWAIQLWLSPLWLQYYRFGPVEWLWRSLTYGKAQPIQVSAVG